MTNSVKEKLALYLHVPFCVSKCHYCDFNSFGIGTAPPPEAVYLDRIRREIAAAGRILADDVPWLGETVFFGGGTPSIFSPEAIGAMLGELRTLLPIRSGAETTLEMNPKTASLEKMRGFRDAGINRFSIGVQTLDEDLLHGLARAHSAHDALQALSWAFESGTDRVSADLMYGLSGQTLRHVEASLAKLAQFPLQHLSAYELIVEEGTPFYDRYLEGRLPLPKTGQVLRMREMIHAFAAAKGMAGYEVSNFAVPGEESAHNLAYWNYDSFLGFGAGAVSFLRREQLSREMLAGIADHDPEQVYGVRWTNPRSLAEYQADWTPWGNGNLEAIRVSEAMGEFMMMGLRRNRGIRYSDFREKFGRDLPAEFFLGIADAERRGWLEADAEGCRFTESGMLLSNEVLQNFI